MDALVRRVGKVNAAHPRRDEAPLDETQFEALDRTYFDAVRTGMKDSIGDDWTIRLAKWWTWSSKVLAPGFPDTATGVVPNCDPLRLAADDGPPGDRLRPGTGLPHTASACLR